MECYFVNEWILRYEVNDKGDSFKPGQKMRAKLKYVKLAVYGHKEGVGWKKLKQIVGETRMLETFGLFTKCLELAADQDRSQRGWLLEEKNIPATPQYLALIWSIPVGQVQRGLGALCQVGWLSQSEYEPKMVVSGDHPEVPGADGTVRPNNTNTKQNNTEQNTTLSGKAKCTTAQGFLLKVADLFHIQGGTPSHTTFKKLSNHLADYKDYEPFIFDKAIKIAKEKINTPTLKKPIAAFIRSMQNECKFPRVRA